MTIYEIQTDSRQYSTTSIEAANQASADGHRVTARIA